MKSYNDKNDHPDWDYYWSHNSYGLNYICGLATNYSKFDSNKGVAVLILYSFPSLTIIYEDHKLFTTDLPYLAGFESFRVVP